jgi:hypothetical protein
MAVRLQALEWRMSRMEVGMSMALAQLGLKIPDIPFPGATPAARPAPQPPLAPPGPVLKDGPYQYRPLAAGKSEVRILKLIGGCKDSDPIECSLIHVDLDRKGKATHGDAHYVPLAEFGAVSYTWGDPALSESILMEGHRFPVTKNLKAALLRLRATPRPAINAPHKTEQPRVSYWWIDAVCVNQVDIDERNSQVLLMRHLYHAASRVHVWLGEAEDDSDRVFRLVEELDKPLPSRGPGLPEPEPLVVSDDERRKNWAAMVALFARRWWRRVWVRQEVALNMKIVVSCGGSACYFHQLVKLAKMANLLGLQTGADLPATGPPATGTSTSIKSVWYTHPEELSTLQNQTTFGSKFSDLAPLLFHGRTCQATDLRDKVFALLGMADPKVYGLVPNYRLPLRRVIIEAARTAISKSSKLDLLAAAQNPTRRNRLPSWAPNLVDEWKAWPLPEKDGWSTTMKTTATTIEFGGGENEETLTVKGTRCDTISLFSPDAVAAEDSTATLQETYLRWKAFAHDAEHAAKRPYGAYRHSMEHNLLAAQNDRDWLEFVSVRTDTQWFAYGADGALLGPKQEAGLGLRPVDDRPRTYLIPSEFDGNAAHPCARIHASMRKHAAGRRLGFSTNGCLGLFPGDARLGDLIVAVPGAFHPLVLREQGAAFVLVGQACELLFSCLTQVDSKSC